MIRIIEIKSEGGAIKYFIERALNKRDYFYILNCYIITTNLFET